MWDWQCKGGVLLPHFFAFLGDSGISNSDTSKTCTHFGLIFLNIYSPSGYRL